MRRLHPAVPVSNFSVLVGAGVRDDQPGYGALKQLEFDVRMVTAEAPRGVVRFKLAERDARGWRRRVFRLVRNRRAGFEPVAPGVGLGLVVGRAMGIFNGGGGSMEIWVGVNDL